jgi:hypothetical protein
MDIIIIHQQFGTSHPSSHLEIIDTPSIPLPYLLQSTLTRALVCSSFQSFFFLGSNFYTYTVVCWSTYVHNASTNISLFACY